MNEQGQDYYHLLGRLYSVVGLANENGKVMQRDSHDAYGLPTAVAGDMDGDRDVDLAESKISIERVYMMNGIEATLVAQLIQDKHRQAFVTEERRR